MPTRWAPASNVVPFPNQYDAVPPIAAPLVPWTTGANGKDRVDSRRIIAHNWETLVEWLETIEDTAIAQQAFAQLKAAGGDRAKAGWRKWSEVEGELA